MIAGNFGWAIEMLRAGQLVTRKGWNGPGQYLAIQKPDTSPLQTMSVPYIFITTVQGERVPWLASQTDMLATDWEVPVAVS